MSIKLPPKLFDRLKAFLDSESTGRVTMHVDRGRIKVIDFQTSIRDGKEQDPSVGVEHSIIEPG